MQDRIQFSATINRKKIGPVDVPKDLMMIEFLQEYAGMNGTRLGCGQGVCRASRLRDRRDLAQRQNHPHRRRHCLGG